MKQNLIFLFVAIVMWGCGGGDKPAPDPTPNPNQPKVMIGTPALEGHAYEWSPCDALSDCRAAQPLASPAKSTQYMVTATTKCGKSTSQVWVRIYKNVDGALVEVL